MSLTGTVFAGKYRIEALIGEGAFGKIYIAKSTETNEQVAVKLEVLGRKRSQLLEEAKIYKIFQGNPGIPKFYCVSTEGGYHGMAMELLGSSMETLMGLCGNRFTMPTALMVAEQMVERIELFHSKGFLHRDIKPENFTIGCGTSSTTVYMIDYGLVKRYRNPKTRLHIPLKQNKKLTGTARYSSINTHMGFEQSRRDDLEGIGYTIIYLAKGELPWQGIKGETKKEKYNKIMEKKCDVPIETLCKGMPGEFISYMYYVRGLQFEDKPDYTQLRKQFKDCFYKNHFDKGFSYDWIKQGVDIKTYKKTTGEQDSNKAEDGQGQDAKLKTQEFVLGDGLKKSADALPVKTRASHNDLAMKGNAGMKPADGGEKKRATKAKAEEEEKKGPAKAAAEEKEAEGGEADMSKFVMGLPTVLLKIAKEAKKKDKEKKESKKCVVPEPGAQQMPSVKEEKHEAEEVKAAASPSQAALLDQFVAANSKEVKLEDKMKGVQPEVLKRGVSHDFSEKNSCNFNVADIVESRELIGIVSPLAQHQTTLSLPKSLCTAPWKSPSVRTSATHVTGEQTAC